MTPEAQRIAIAEACGWQLLGPDYGDKIRKSHMITPDGEDVASPPDYLNSLDAIVPAIRDHFKTDEQQMDFSREIQRIIKPHGSICFCCAVSLPGQLSEAFLKTIGKWEEGQ